MRLCPTLIAGVCVIGFAPAASFAHARLLRAEPPVGGAVRGSPKALRITFSEPLVISFSSVQIVDGAGRAVPAGKPVLDASDRRVLVEPLRSPLAPGRYTARWRAVSVDTHRVEGSYAFRIDP